MQWSLGDTCTLMVKRPHIFFLFLFREVPWDSKPQEFIIEEAAAHLINAAAPAMTAAACPQLPAGEERVA